MIGTLQWDGYIVQRSPPPESKYKGAASAEAWPLTFADTPQATELSEETKHHFYGYDEQGRYLLWIVPSMDLALRYLRACESLKIRARLLACATSEPEVPTNAYRSPGWDIVSPSFSSSLIDVEVLSGDPGLSKRCAALCFVLRRGSQRARDPARKRGLGPAGLTG